MKTLIASKQYFNNRPLALADFDEISRYTIEQLEGFNKQVARGQHLYFVVAPELNRVKIGIAADPHQRLMDLQVSCPTRLYIEFVCPYVGRETEKKLHKAFKDLNISGEWFEYHEDIKKHIKKMREMTRASGIVWDLVQKRLVYLRD